VGLDRRVAVLLGAILVVTGPTVIGPLLRHVRPNRRVSSILKWEGIVIDPIGAVLALLVFESVVHGESQHTIGLLLKIIAIGVIIGGALAAAFVWLMQHYWIPDFLHNPALLAAAMVAFTASNQLAPESGLLTVTVLGVALANQRRVDVRHMLEFKENLRVLLISGLFILLAARIRMSDLLQLGWGGVAFVLLLILVVRPVSVYLATLRTELTWAERTFLAFLAPRGIVAAAVSSVFALELAKSGEGTSLAGFQQIVPLTFLVIVGTVTCYGLGAVPLARWLKIASANPQGILFAGAAPWVRQIAGALQAEGIAVMLVDTNYSNVSAARQAGLEATCMSIVSESVEEMDFGGIGRLLAMTSNDDLNTLATHEFTAEFGSANVFQLAHRAAVSEKRTGESRPGGRLLFDTTATFTQLSQRFAAGATIKVTSITPEFTFEDFRLRYGSSALVLFVYTETRQLIVAATDETCRPSAGQLLIALIDPPSEHASSEATAGV
ncbi:MAG: cation:proton antiporter, partial [Planctomycetales bacterium]|nr:cation:proton antiporter [Planctomycetales bacterium]